MTANPTARVTTPATAGDAVLELVGLGVDHGARTAVHAILRRWRGEIFGLLGPNGAGKTTTISMACGVVPPTRGTARFAGADLRSRTFRLLVLPLLFIAIFGYVFKVSGEKQREARPITVWNGAGPAGEPLLQGLAGSKLFAGLRRFRFDR